MAPTAWSTARALVGPVDDPLLQCLVTLTRLLERPTSGPALSAGLPLVAGELTPELVARAAARAGLSGRFLKRPLERIDGLSLPCILLLKERRACVLIGRSGDGRCTVVLPEAGEGTIELRVDELAERYEGFAFFARPELRALDRNRETEVERKGHWFWGVLLAQWAVYGEVALAAVMINVFALASPLFVMNVYDRVVPNNALETLWVLAIGAALVFTFDFGLRMLRVYFVDSAGRVADIELASRIFAHVLAIRMAVRPRSGGAFASHLREFESLRDFFTSATITTLVDLPFIGMFILVVWLIAGPVALVPTIAVPIVIGIGLLTQIPLNRVVRRTYRQGAQKHGVLVETINGLETIKALAAESRMQQAWEALVAATAEASNRSRLLSAMTVNLASFASNLVTIGTVVVGVQAIGAGDLTVGALVAATIIAGRAMAPLGQVAATLTRFHQARASLDTLDGLMRLPTERPPGKVFVHRPVTEGAIEFRNVAFSYPGQRLAALRDVSFKIAPGEKVGLIGRIGSGKTTIEKLVLGLYEPDSGVVLLDGTELRQIDPADLRRAIGCVPQDVVLFQGTLRENITFGMPQADDAAVLRAAQIAGVEDFAARHPLGYDLEVGERGETLSGGQRQAVAIARALIAQPPVLVMDEPTSSMDTTSETRFLQRIIKELPGRTFLIVTHRASLLSIVDRIIVMDMGRVVADGPKDKVLEALAQGRIKGET